MKKTQISKELYFSWKADIVTKCLMEELKDRIKKRKLSFFEEIIGLSAEEVIMKSHELVGYELAVQCLNDFEEIKDTVLFDRFEEERELEKDEESNRRNKSAGVENSGSSSKRVNNRREWRLQSGRSVETERGGM